MLIPHRAPCQACHAGHIQPQPACSKAIYLLYCALQQWAAAKRNRRDARKGSRLSGSRVEFQARRARSLIAEVKRMRAAFNGICRHEHAGGKAHATHH